MGFLRNFAQELLTGVSGGIPMTRFRRAYSHMGSWHNPERLYFARPLAFVNAIGSAIEGVATCEKGTSKLTFG